MIEAWPGAEQFMNYIKPSLTLKQLRTLREFYMAQQALAQELLEAKRPGICKIITSGENPILEENQATVIDGGLPENDSKEIL